MRITSSYFRELHKNTSYSKLLLAWTWEHNIMQFSFGPTFWVLFTRGYLVWTMSSLFWNFGRTFPFVWGGGGRTNGKQPIAKRSRTKNNNNKLQTFPTIISLFKLLLLVWTLPWVEEEPLDHERFTCFHGDHQQISEQLSIFAGCIFHVYCTTQNLTDFLYCA